MIIVYGRKLIIPKIDSIIGWQGDNLVETRTFELTRLYNDIDLSIFDYKLDIQSGTSKNIIDLVKTILEDKIILTWTVMEAHLINAGLAKIQVRGFNAAVEKWHSNVEYITIKESINASESFPNPLPSEFSEMEIRITAAKDTTVAASEAAALSKTNAGVSEDAAKLSETNAKASENAADLSETNAETSEINAKASENAAKLSETNAKASEDAAKLSETNAGTSEDAAKLSETNAKTSETNTTTQANIATTKAAEAAGSLDEFLAKANGLFNVGSAQPIYGLWLEEV